MGTFRKVSASAISTVLVMFLSFFLIRIAYDSNLTWKWRTFLVVVVTLYFLFYAVFMRSLIRLRCKHCGSWNVWRNILARSTGLDFSNPNCAHYWRETWCYSCKRETDQHHWIRDSGDLFAIFR